MGVPVVAETKPSRRARLRQATIDEIKERARRQLTESGPGTLSLRAIAREMGTAPSALYRYFANSDELISALCVDAYDSVADALTEARDAQPAEDYTRQWWAMARAYRRWALDHRADFALIFGTPVPNYKAPPEVTGPAAGRFIGVPLAVFAAAVQTGMADPARTYVPPTIQTGDLWGAVLGHAATESSSQLAGLLLNAAASLRGYLMTEIFGRLDSLIDDRDRLFRAHLRTVMVGMGFAPTSVGAADAYLEA